MCRVMRSPRPTLLVLSRWPTCTWGFCPHRATKSRPHGDGPPPLKREAFYDLEIVSSQGNPNFGLLLKSFSVKSWKQVSDFGKSQRKIRATMVQGEAEIYDKKSLFLFLCDMKKEERPLTKLNCLFRRCCLPFWEFYLCLFADDVVLFLSSPNDLQNTPQRFASKFGASAWITSMRTRWRRGPACHKEGV